MSTTEQRCSNGHFYNPSKFSTCPHCGVSGIDLGVTVPAGSGTIRPTVPIRSQGVGPTAPVQETPTIPLGQIRNNSCDKATVAYYPSRMAQEPGEAATDPIVGWFVCVDGPDRGRDFRIKAEKNFIGRSTTMDICISGDQRISRENHAVVAFDPRNVEFRLYSGDARGLVYLNGSMVDIPVVLHAYDAIELGASRLLFIPFCSERFQWSDK